ncbi:MAG: RpiB/LacA/LacB family sugar-phosphate isomerase, partial [Paramuribaculum sp.]|nr:RpiB/LacA/LacB family sugar-phosphate isomerase [Paramuribaculum sp.]
DRGIATEDFGTNSADSCDYPDFAHPAALAIEAGACYPAIAMCGTGNGISMTLNKHQGIRAALCWNTDLARLAREHNDANTLVLPARFISKEEAFAIIDTFLSTPFEGGRHIRRIEKIPLH